MESIGIYWKSPYTALEWHGLNLAEGNARHVKQVVFVKEGRHPRAIRNNPNSGKLFAAISLRHSPYTRYENALVKKHSKPATVFAFPLRIRPVP
jgi:hypothetical protein